MRWEELFADLEGQYDEVERAEMAGEVADRTRREAARLRLLDRLGPATGSMLTVRVVGVGAVRGRLTGAGADWLLLAESAARDLLVPLAAVLWVTGLSARSVEPGSAGYVAGRLDLGYALRRLARDRATARIALVDGSVVAGTIDRVGRDFVELTECLPGELRRPTAATVLAVPHAAIALVSSA